MKTFRLTSLFVFVALMYLPTAHAITLTTKAPTVNIPTVTVTLGGLTQTVAFPASLNTSVNDAAQTAFADAETEANLELSPFDRQDQLAKGFANANAYAARAGTLQGYQDYSLFAVSAGVMVGIQAPRSPFSSYDNIGDEIEEEGDIFAGVGVGASILNIGINANILPIKAVNLDRFYFNLKYGSYSVNESDVDASITTYGLGVNYTYMRTKSMAKGFFKWRGVSLGTGFLVNKNDIDFSVDLTDQVDPFTFSAPGTVPNPYGAGSIPITVAGQVKLDPSFTLGLSSTTYTIPLEVDTSVMLLWFMNFNLGLGVDLTFGSTDIIIESSADVTPEITSVTTTTPGFGLAIPDDSTTAGNASIDASTKGVSPTLANVRVSTGLGFNIGPLKLDIPLAYYFNSGLSAGVTAGIVW